MLSRRVSEPTGPPDSEPATGVSILSTMRHARDRGRLVDPALVHYKKHLSFEDRLTSKPYGWWNGLVYSWHQLLTLTQIEGVLSQRKYRRHNGKWVASLAAPDTFQLQAALRFRKIALAATALEARYFPALDPEWLYLSGLGDLGAEWRTYRSEFDPVAMAGVLTYSPDDIRKDAEHLLHRAHSIDPVGRPWSSLIRRAPRSSWKDLSGPALSAMDHRIAAELLLRFYEDLVVAGVAKPLEDYSDLRAYHPLIERLSYRRQTLDQDLMQLGISPHPRVVLAIEGKTEEIHVPKVWNALDLPDAPELVRVINLNGADKDPVIAGALASTPLLEGLSSDGEYWLSIKPPTCFMVAVDPEGRFYAPGKVESTKRKILDAIKGGLEAQGAEVDEEQLDPLVEIYTWKASCYEFAHFSDDELADGLMAVHDGVNGLSRADLISAFAATRAHDRDIKEVWSRWTYQPSKPKLAEALWPYLDQKIEAARSGGPTPEIASVLYDVYLTAQNWRHKTIVWPVKKV